MGNTDPNQVNTAQQEEHTFTQEELNAIVADRLARERSKYGDYEELKQKAAAYDEAEEANKTELQKQTERAEKLQAQYDALVKTNSVREAREKVARETGVPVELLTSSDEESCKKQAEAILNFAKPKSYPGPKRTERQAQNESATDSAMRELAHQLFGKGE